MHFLFSFVYYSVLYNTKGQIRHYNNELLKVCILKLFVVDIFTKTNERFPRTILSTILQTIKHCVDKCKTMLFIQTGLFSLIQDKIDENMLTESVTPWVFSYIKYSFCKL